MVFYMYWIMEYQKRLFLTTCLLGNCILRRLWLGGALGNAIFILITGYFMINKIVRTKKIILLVFNMLFYSWLILICVYIVMPELLTSAKIIKLILPILFGENWFVTCYIQFFCFVPYLNKFLIVLDKRQYLAFLLIVFFIFFVIAGDKNHHIF